MNWKRKFCEGMGFERIKSTILREYSLEDVDSGGDVYFPESKKDFVKKLEEQWLWWDKEFSEKWFEDEDEILEYYDADWDDFCQKHGLDAEGKKIK